MTIELGYAQISHFFGGAGLPEGAAVVYGIKLDELLPDPLTIATACHANWEATLLVEQSVEVSLLSTICKFGPDSTGAWAEYSEVLAGGDGANGTSSAVAYLLTKQSALGGRRGRGRMFVPGVGESYVNSAGQLTTGKVTSLNTKADDLLSNLTSQDRPMVILHGPSTEWVLDDGKPKRVPVAGPVPEATIVTSLVASSEVATQRRRQR